VANPVLEVRFADARADARADAPGGAGRRAMTVQGSVVRSLSFVALTIAGGVAGWASVARVPAGVAEFPGTLWVVGVAAFVLAVVAAVNPRAAGPCGAGYALGQGAVLGGVSAVYQTRFDGIVLQAVAITIAAFLAVLVLRLAGVVRATGRFRRIVFTAMSALLLVYLCTWLVDLLTPGVPYAHEARALGVGLALLVCVLAAANFVIDFDAVEAGAEHGAPQYMEWYAAFGLTVTLLWLYVSVLRLLAMLAARR